MSATSTLLLASTAIPKGCWNWPFPPPWLPHLARNVPVLVNLWMRRLAGSLRKMSPPLFLARPSGSWNCPSPKPGPPHWVTGVPVSVNSRMRRLPTDSVQ